MKLPRRLLTLGIFALVVSCDAERSTEVLGPIEDARRGGSLVVTDKADFISMGTVSGGNSIYTVFVEDIPGLGVGLYTARTGPSHPVTVSTGSPQNVLFGDGFPGTSFNTIRSYTTGTDYVQLIAPSPSPPFSAVSLDPAITPGIAASVTPVGSTGFTTTYMLPGPPATPDALTIAQVVNVNGSTFDDSSIEVTTTVTNNGTTETVRIGIRYLWDFQVGSDDGPPFAERNPDAAPIVTEAEFVAPGFEFYRMQDNDINTPTPLFSIFGTVNGPTAISPTPTPPAIVQHVAWPLASATAFDYTTDPALDVATTSAPFRGFAGGDNAVLYVFGPDDANAVVLSPGASITVSHSLFASLPGEPPFGGGTEVEIDIKPGSFPNSINCNRPTGVIPVAILTTDEFDATTVDHTTVTFEGASEAHVDRRSGEPRRHEEDVDGDGDVDLVFHFTRGETALTCESTEGVLIGETFDGESFEGSDSVRMIDAGSRGRGTGRRR